MARLAFTLTMPGRGGAVSTSFGRGRNYVVVRTVSESRAEEILRVRDGLYWHRWDDGWVAQIAVTRIAPRTRKLPKSDGFAGYDWMVDNIIAHLDPTGAR
jgi:hypothetical protein